MESTRRFYNELAQTIQFYKNTLDRKEYEWNFYAELRIKRLESHLPSGSGLDNGSKINLDLSTPQKIVIDTTFHHMDKNGYYDGYTTHCIIITSCLQHGYKIHVTGRNKNNIKEYLYSLFNNVSIC